MYAPRVAETPHRWVGWVTIVLYLAAGVFPYLASGLMVPFFPWYLLLMLLYGIGLVFVIRFARRKPVLSLVSIPIAILFWWLYLTMGEMLLGWTA